MKEYYFEQFTQPGLPAPNLPLVTLGRNRGNININVCTFELLGKPRAVTLFYNREQKLIGIRPATKEDVGAIIIRKQKDSRTYFIAAGAFCDFYQIKQEATRRFVAKEYNDMLVIDLQGDSLPPGSRGSLNTNSINLSR